MALATEYTIADLRDLSVRRCGATHGRINWMALSCAGLLPYDICHVSKELPQMQQIAKAIGLQLTPTANDATLGMLYRPKEPDLLGRVNRLEAGSRLIVFNMEDDIDAMMDRTFDLAIAAVFDRDSGMVLRLFDSLTEKGDRRGLESYIHIELNELTDASLSIQASRIAAMR